MKLARPNSSSGEEKTLRMTAEEEMFCGHAEDAAVRGTQRAVRFAEESGGGRSAALSGGVGGHTAAQTHKKAAAALAHVAISAAAAARQSSGTGRRCRQKR